MEVSAVLLDMLDRFANDPKLDSVAQGCCRLARQTIKELQSECDLLKGWKNIAEINGDKMRQYLQDKEALEDIVMNTKEMAEVHNKEVEYCYSEINKALDLMGYVDDSSGRLNEAKDILENISLGTFILEVSK